jgi:phage-related protein
VADDINLPNLISHLQVNLADTSGVIADATRQGSSVGAALGESMQARISAAVDDIPDVEIDANSTELDRDLARVRRELSDLAEQRIGVDITIEDALRRMEDLEPHLERLQRTHPNVLVTASVGNALADLASIRDAAREMDDENVEIDVDIDTEESRRTLERLRDVLSRLGGASRFLIGLAGATAPVAAGLGAVIPLLAGVVATLVQIAPAAAVGVSAMLAMKLASGAVQLAMVGMDEALGAALDPEKAEEFNKALEKLSPSARAFALQVRTLAPALRELQQGVQERFFRGLDTVLKTTATSTLPVLRRALLSAADSTRAMAVGVAQAATQMAKNGTLGRAVDGATAGLSNMRRIPGQITAGLIQIGAAAAPAFQRLTSGASGVADRISQKLTAAFESGAMERAINQAIALLQQLAVIGGNVFAIVGSIFGAAEASGGGFLGVLQSITAAMAAAFASPQVQAGLRALFGVMSQLAAAAGPLLASALTTIAGIMVQLGPPVQALVEHLGAGLLAIFQAAGPVLVSVAGAFGQLVTAALPLVDLAAQLIAAVLPALVPLFESLGQIIGAAAPFVQQLAENLGAQLLPLLTTLATTVLPQLLPPFVNLAETIFPLLTDVLIQLAPGLAAMGIALADVLVAATPLIVAVLQLVAALAERLLPILTPVMIGLALLVSGGLRAVSDFITRYAAPAITALAQLLRGDFSGALATAQGMARRMAEDIARNMQGMRQRAGQAVDQLGSWVAQRFSRMGAEALASLSGRMAEVVGVLRSLPGRALSAMGNMNGLLVGAGRALIQGLINGVVSKVGELSSQLQSITAMIPDWKGPAERDATILAPAGRLLIQGLQNGVAAQLPSLRAQLRSITADLPGMTLGAMSVTASAAGTGGGDTYNTFHLHGGDASPDGILRALSWRSLVGGTSG